MKYIIKKITQILDEARNDFGGVFEYSITQKHIYNSFFESEGLPYHKTPVYITVNSDIFKQRTIFSVNSIEELENITKERVVFETVAQLFFDKSFGYMCLDKFRKEFVDNLDKLIKQMKKD